MARRTDARCAVANEKAAVGGIARVKRHTEEAPLVEEGIEGGKCPCYVKERRPKQRSVFHDSNLARLLVDE
jgi:hypothetical protein